METGSSATMRFGLSKRPRDHQALSLPAAQLMRIFLQDFFAPQAHNVQGLLDHRIGFPPAVRQAEIPDHHVERVSYLVERVVYRVRVLKDGLHVPPVFARFACPSSASHLRL